MLHVFEYFIFLILLIYILQNVSTSIQNGGGHGFIVVSTSLKFSLILLKVSHHGPVQTLARSVFWVGWWNLFKTLIFQINDTSLGQEIQIWFKAVPSHKWISIPSLQLFLAN